MSFDGRDDDDFPSIVSSSVEVGAVGNSGGIDITTSSLSITNRAQILSNTQGRGNAGNISIEAQNQIFLSDSDIITEVTEGGGIGKGGNININTGTLLLQDGSSLLADVENIGRAGNITINARDRMIVEGEGLSSFRNSTDIFPSQITSTVDSNAVGEGGDITISTGTLLVNDEAFIRTDNLGQGNAGDIKITATDSVSLTAGGEISADTTGEGNAGNITIDTKFLSVKDSQVSSTTFNAGDAGNLTVRASELVELSGEILRQDGTIASPGGLLAQVNQDTGKGKGGDLTIETGRLNVSNGSKVQVATFGEGDAGNLFIQADEIDIFNTSNADNGFSTGIFAGVLLDSRSVRIPKGNGGNLTIETDRLNIRNRGKVSADTDGIGDAGDIDIVARGQVFLDGQGSGISSSVNLGAIGNGGNIKITADSLGLSNGAAIVTSTFGNGKAGNIDIELGDHLSIDGSGSGLFAVTQYQFVVTEINPDAGESLSTAQNLTNQNGQLVNGITGSLASNNDVDIYQITLPGNQTFSATTVNRSTNVDTRLFLFDANGQGVYSNDDENDQTRQSTLPSGNPFTPKKAGNYYLAITSYENEPLSKEGNIFSSGSFTDILGASKDGGSRTLSSWSNNGTDNGAYVINITDSSTTPTGISGGTGGNINVRAASLSISNNAQISAESGGQGNAGNIKIDLEGTLNTNNGSIITSAEQSSGGTINITAEDIRLFDNSNIRTNVADGTGAGGDINLTANTIVALDNSDIFSFSADGKGGNITFNTAGFFSNPLYKPTSPIRDRQTLSQLNTNQQVDVNASGAISGTITGIPDTTFIQDSLTDLPENQIDTNIIVASSCIIRNNQQTGTFFITGSGGLPQNPSDAPLSNYSTGKIQSIPNTSEKSSTSATQHSWKIGDPIIEPTGAYQLPSGQIVLSRECSK